MSSTNRANYSVEVLEPIIRQAFDNYTPFKSIYKYEPINAYGKIVNKHDYLYGVDFYFNYKGKEYTVDIKLIKRKNDKGELSNFSVNKSTIHRELNRQQKPLDYFIFCHGDECYICEFTNIAKWINTLSNEDKFKVDKGNYYLIPLSIVKEYTQYKFNTPQKLYLPNL